LGKPHHEVRLAVETASPYVPTIAYMNPLKRFWHYLVDRPLV